MHVANGVDMDDESDSTYNEHHNQSQGVYLKSKVDRKVPSAKPSPDNLLENMLAFRQHEKTHKNQNGSQER